jgi:hypothetical protein
MSSAPPPLSALSADRLQRAKELRAMALMATTKPVADALNRMARGFERQALAERSRLASEPPDAAQTAATADWWGQHYLRTGNPRALRCANVCNAIAVQRQSVARSELASTDHNQAALHAQKARAAAITGRPDANMPAKDVPDG